MPQLAEAAELATGTLYIYFKSKEEIYAALLLEGYDVLLEKMKRVRGGSPRELIRNTITAFFDFAQKTPEYFDIIFFVRQQEARRKGPELSAELMARIREKEDAVRAIAREALTGALGTPGFRLRSKDVAAFAETSWAMLAGVALYRIGDSDAEAREKRNTALGILLDALFE